MITNSDVIIVNALTSLGVPVNSANPQNGNSINLADNSGVEAESVVLATRGDCSEGEMFQKSNNANSSSVTMAGGNVNPGNNGNNFNLNYDPQTRVYQFTSMAYYIGQGTNGEPALFRRMMTPLQPPKNWSPALKHCKSSMAKIPVEPALQMIMSPPTRWSTGTPS